MSNKNFHIKNGLSIGADNEVISSALAGTFSAATISGDLTVDSSTLKVDSSNNRVGIGTTSPDSIVHVKSAGAASALLNLESTHSGGIPIYNMKGAHSSQLRYQDENGDNQSRIDFHDAGRMDFIDAANGNTRMRIHSSGHVSIKGTANASGDGLSNLTLGDGSGDAGLSIYSATSGNGRLMFADGTSGGAQYDGFMDYNHSDQSLGLGTGASGGRDLTISSDGSIKSGSGGMVLQTKEAYNSTAASVSGTATTVVNSLSITVKANSKVAVWFNSGQTQNQTIAANPNGNIQWVNSGGTVTNISDHNYNHTWWDGTDNIERQNLISQGISGALSAGTYTIRFLGGTYGGTTTWNFQSQGSHLIVQEIAAD